VLAVRGPRLLGDAKPQPKRLAAGPTRAAQRNGHEGCPRQHGLRERGTGLLPLSRPSLGSVTQAARGRHTVTKMAHLLRPWRPSAYGREKSAGSGSQLSDMRPQHRAY